MVIEESQVTSWNWQGRVEFENFNSILLIQIEDGLIIECYSYLDYEKAMSQLKICKIENFEF